MIKIKPFIRKKGALYPASDEQNLIVRDITNGKNVVVDAVAGSGKTSTILHIAQANSDKRILALTYNKNLRSETKQRSTILGVTNLDIHTYHSAVGTYYNIGTGGYASSINAVIQGTALQRKCFNHHILIIDEAQDMNYDFYLLVQRFLQNFDNSPVIAIFGDVNQCIYDFGSCPADQRFLILVRDLYGDREWTHRNLSVSYRITRNIAKFVNHMIGHERINATKDGDKVEFIVGNPFNAHNVIIQYLCNKKLLSAPGDIFILASSVKASGNKKPIHYLENALVNMGVPVYRPLSDITELNTEETKGKVVISTFHQAKGRERKVVICYGYDDGYFMYSGKLRKVQDGVINPVVCPNEWYVAATRATEKLIIVGGRANPQWMNIVPPNDCCNIVGQDFTIKKCVPSAHRDLEPIDVTELVRFKTSGQVFIQLQSLYNALITTSRKGSEIIIDTLVKGKGESTENVADITALAVSFKYEHMVKGQSIACDYVERNRQQQKQLVQTGIKCYNIQLYNSAIDEDQWNVENWLRLATEYEAYSSGYHNRVHQITNYSWLTDVQWNMLLMNYEIHVGKDENIVLEKDIKVTHETLYGKVQLKGRIDALSKDQLWEFKLVTEIKPEHILQTIIYMWMLNSQSCRRDEECCPDLISNYSLLNIRNGYRIDIIYDRDVIEKIMELLFHTHYAIAKEHDVDFIRKCSNTLTTTQNIEYYDSDSDKDPDGLDSGSVCLL